MYRSFQQNIPDRGAILSERIKSPVAEFRPDILPRCHAAHDLDVVSTLPAQLDGASNSVPIRRWPLWSGSYDHPVAMVRMTGNAPQIG